MSILDRLQEEARLLKIKRAGNRLRLFVGTEVNARSILESPVRLGRQTLISDSHIGRYSYFGERSRVSGAHIGRFFSGAWGITIGAESHPMDTISSHTFPWNQVDGGFVDGNAVRPELVDVGNDVWVGCNAVVLSGLKIGNGAVIGAGAIVRGDVPSYAVMVGVPARMVGQRFDDDMVARVEKLRWWDWPPEVLKANVGAFQRTLDEKVLAELEVVARDMRIGTGETE